MDKETKDAWMASATAIKAVLCRRDKRDPFLTRQRQQPQIFGSLRNFVNALPDDFAKWDDTTTAAALMERVVASPRSDRRADEALKHKCIRLGYALAFSDPDVVLPSERAFMRDNFRQLDMPPEPKPASAPSPGPSFAVDFGFAFDQERRGGGYTSPARAVGNVLVERVDASEAPLAWTLPLLRGGDVSVRAYDGKFFRPVFAPNSETPIEEGDFARASAGDDPWQDNPFLPKAPGIAMALHEYARPPKRTTALDEEERNKSLSTALTTVGRLVSIDGIVHRETEEPTFHIVVRKSPHRAVMDLAWRLRGVAFGDSQETMLGYGETSVDWGMTLDVDTSFPVLFQDYGLPRPAPGLSFPAFMIEAARDVRTRLARLTQTPVAIDRIVPHGSFSAPVDPIAVTTTCLLSLGMDRWAFGDVVQVALRVATSCLPLQSKNWTPMKRSAYVSLTEAHLKSLQGAYADEATEEDDSVLSTMSF